VALERPAAFELAALAPWHAAFCAKHLQLWPNRGLFLFLSLFIFSGGLMGNKIVTEADRKATPQPKTLPGFTLPTGGRGQRVSLERGVNTRNKKNPGKRPHQG